MAATTMPYDVSRETKQLMFHVKHFTDQAAREAQKYPQVLSR